MTRSDDDRDAIEHAVEGFAPLEEHGGWDMGIYEKLGVRRLINANAATTRLGGSLMPPEVLEAMREAAGSFVDMFELQRAVSRRIAELTHNEAALVCSSATAGLFLGTLGCMTGRDLQAVARLMEEGPDWMQRREVVIHQAHRFAYEMAVKLAGGSLVPIGSPTQTRKSDLESVLNERTAAVLFIAGSRWAAGALPLDQVIATAHAAGVPVIVDAASQLPPPENLWRFTQQGADLVVFSGGKGLRGPQSTGLILGRADLVEACALHASPNNSLGRPMKVGKEEMVGLLAAIERYLALDHAALAAHRERVVAWWVAELNNLPGIAARRDFPSEAGQPIPRALVTFDASLGLTGESVRRALLAGDPAVDVAVAGEAGIYLNPEPLEAGEEEVVCRRFRSIATASGGSTGT